MRLLKAAEYRWVFEKPVKIHKHGFSVYFRAHDRSTARLGLAIPKKALRKAVDRNRIKRLVRESFRCNLYRIQSCDVIFLARKELADIDNQHLRVLLDKVWDQLKTKP